MVSAAEESAMQRFTPTLEFPDLKPRQRTTLRAMAEKCLREDSGGRFGLDDEVDGWDMSFWLFRLLLCGCSVIDVFGEERAVKASMIRTQPHFAAREQ